MNGPRWLGSTPPFRQRVLIAAPHPDDEVLGCSGIMRWLDNNGHCVEIVAITDGEASHARSRNITPIQLVERRADERVAALSALDLNHVPVFRLGFPDSALASMESDLVGTLRSHLDSSTTLVVPSPSDGHPDHEAVARAGMRAAAGAGSGCVVVPIWARVRGDRCRPVHVLALGSVRADKCAAVREYRSQMEAVGPDPFDGPVVHPHELDRLTSGTEWIVEAL